MRTRLKICCIASVEEAELAIRYGADALGLVAKMPSGPGPIPDAAIHEIARWVPPPIASFLLTSETEAEAIVEHIRRTHVNTVQIVDDAVDPNIYPTIRQAVPAVKIVQTIHVQDESAIGQATEVSRYVDALLLDSGNPKAVLRTLGGTGQIHNWGISREIVRTTSRPVFLAGGINATNIAAAIQQVRPYGIDLCSGVRENGKLQPEKLAQLVAAFQLANPC